MALKSVHTTKISIFSGSKNSWIHCWEPRTKLCTSFLTVLGLVSLQTPKLLILSFLLLSILVFTMGASVKQIIIRIGWISPFLLFMTIPLLVGGGFPPSQERYTLALLLVFKSLSALLVMFIIFFSQPIPILLNSLAHMKLPDFFVSIIFLSWRYVFLFWETLQQFFKSLKSRLFQPSFHIYSFKVYGEIIGGILVKSIDRSEKIYNAMVSRGFHGRIPTSSPQRITSLDLLKSFFMLSVVILLHIVENWRF